MIVTRKSPFSGKVHSMDLPVTEEQLEKYFGRSSKNTALIQDIFPDLTPDQREFIMTGITPQEWDEEFGEEE